MNGGFYLCFLLEVICAIKNNLSGLNWLISLGGLLNWFRLEVICAIKNSFFIFCLFISLWIFVFNFFWIRFRSGWRDYRDTLHVASLVWSVFKLDSNCFTFGDRVKNNWVLKRCSLFCFGLRNKCGLTCINLLFHFFNL
jgi:hypothetical protein